MNRSLNRTYRVVSFGENDHGFWNSPSFHLTVGAAKQRFDETYANPEIDGAVLIEVDNDNWSVRAQFGLENHSVVLQPIGNFRVEKASGLEFITNS
jgi:hypothetical protein